MARTQIYDEMKLYLPGKALHEPGWLEPSRAVVRSQSGLARTSQLASFESARELFNKLCMKISDINFLFTKPHKLNSWLLLIR
jgi:hypothetical protein